MKRVLVTGSTGEIGAALVQGLLADATIERVVGLDLRPPNVALRAPAVEIRDDRFHFTAADIAEPCGDLLLEHGIDTVIHAAYPVEPSHRPAQAQRTATTGTRSLLESAASAGAGAFLHLSSATVYGAHPGNPPLLSESAPLRPNRGYRYALDKLAAEEVVDEYRVRQSFATLLVLRPCFVIGPGTANPFMRHLCRRLVPLPATQSPMQFVHRDDLVHIVLSLLGAGASGTFNVGASGSLTPRTMVEFLHGRAISVRDRLLNIMNTLGWSAHLPLAPAPAPAIDLLRYPWRVDSGALHRVLPNPYRHTSAEAFQSFAEAHLHSRGMGV